MSPSQADLDAAAAMMADAAQAAPSSGARQKQPQPQPQPRAFEQFDTDEMPSSGNGEVNMDLLLDVPVTLSMEVGRSRLPIRNLLQLNQGSVVELEREVGEPLEVFVNGTLVAHGEVVVVNDRFGIRLIDVVSPSDRIRTLK